MLSNVLAELDFEGERPGFDFVHAFCYCPNNPKIIIDAMGARPMREMYDYFYDINPEIDWDIPSTDFLINNYAGKEFHSEESLDYDPQETRRAVDWVQKNITHYSTP